MKTQSILNFKTSRLLTLLAITLGLAVTAPAQHTGPTSIASYVPAKATVGDTVYANLIEAPGGSFSFVFAHAVFKTADGYSTAVPVTYETPLTISFKVPFDAVTGRVTLFPERSIGQGQIELPIVTFNKRLPGILFLNKSQFAITRVKHGETSLLAPGRTLPAGQASMIERVLPVAAMSLEVGYSESNKTRFTTTETVPGVRGALATTLRITRRENITIDPFTVAEVLTMGATNASAWDIQANEVGPYQAMQISTAGVMRLSFRNGTPLELTIDDASAEFSTAGIKFRVRENGVLSGPALIVPPPYDAFATNQIGSFVARARQGSDLFPLLFRRQFLNL